MKALFAQSLLLFSIFAAGQVIPAAGQTVPPDLTGKWKLNIAIQGRTFDQDCAFVQKENVLAGICKGDQGETKIDGSVDGKRVTWSCQADFNGTPVTLKFDGTLADSKISGTVMVDPIAASGDFTAQPFGQDQQGPPPAQGPQGQPRRNDHPGAMESPIIHPDGTVTFVMPAPADVKVADVICDYPVSKHYPNPEHVHMTKDEKTNLWSVTVGPLKPDFYEYTFVVDGVRISDPGNQLLLHSTANPVPGIGSWAIVPGPESDNYMLNDVLHGRVSEAWYPSPALQQKQRRMIVYTPPDYDIGQKRYPVLYLLHNAGGDEESWEDLGRAPEIFDNLLAQGKMVPMIVVMINSNWQKSLSAHVWKEATSSSSISGPAASGPDAGGPGLSERNPPSFSDADMNKIPDSIVRDLVPYIDKTYRTKPGSANRAIAGNSRGGSQALVAALSEHSEFGWAGIFSGDIDLFSDVRTQIPKPADAATRRGPEIGYSIDPANFVKHFPSLGPALNVRMHLLYLALGNQDGLIESWNDARRLLDQKGVKYVWQQQDGGSDWSFWRKALVDFTPRIFGASK
jgi:enterochelin esterase family protein